MFALTLPPDIESRLDALSRRTGRSRDEHVREAILDHIEDLEDAALVEARLSVLNKGQDTVPLSDLMRRYGLED